MFPRDFGRPKTAKVKIYLHFVAFGVLLSSSFGVAVVVSTGGRWCRVQGFRCPAVCAPCFCPAFCPLAALAFLQ